VLLGPELDAFETEFAAFTGKRHCVAVGSGAAALQLALAAAGIGPGDEVLVPAFTAVPTAAAVCATGATPVFVDVDPATATLDPVAASRAVTERTRAVIPVHLYGRPSALPDLGIPVIEDAAQAHGATDPAASSLAQCFSFYPTKNLGGMGDGGAVVTDDDEMATTVRRLRVHGMREQYVHTEIAMNSRLSELEAAWLRITLPGLAAGNERRRAIASHYETELPGLTLQPDHPRHARHLCVARVTDRVAFRDRSSGLGIGTAVHYPLAMTQQPAYRRFATARCPNAEAWAARCVSLPCFPELTDYEVELVVKALS
jgi:dTDP-3-amino-3,4,6-trideoxy-alpha-D-glucose transaminase